MIYIALYGYRKQYAHYHKKLNSSRPLTEEYSEAIAKKEAQTMQHGDRIVVSDGSSQFWYRVKGGHDGQNGIERKRSS